MASKKVLLIMLPVLSMQLLSERVYASPDGQIGASVSDTSQQNTSSFDDNDSYHFSFIAIQSDYYSTTGALIDLGYKPSIDSGIVVNLGIEHLPQLSYEINNVEFEHDFTNLRWSAGYQFDLSQNVHFTSSLGLAINLEPIDSPNIHQGDTQGFVNLKFSYQLSDSFSLIALSNYDFGSQILSDSGSFGVGISYRPSKSSNHVKNNRSNDNGFPGKAGGASGFGYDNFDSDTPATPPSVVVSATSAAALTSTVTGVLAPNSSELPITPITREDEVDSPVAVAPIEPTQEQEQEQIDFEAQPYTIQIGVFNNISSVELFLKQKSIDPTQIFTRTIDSMQKIFYRGYPTVSKARQTLTQLTSRGIDGFVLNTPKIIAEPVAKVKRQPAPKLIPFYAIQLGSFSTLSSADEIITKMQELKRQTFIRGAGDVMKVFTGKYTSLEQAENELANLKQMNISGFVTKID